MNPHPKVAIFVGVALLGLLANAAWAQGPIEEVMAATLRITNGKSSATGFLIELEADGDAAHARTVLVTAGHTMEKMSEPVCTLVLRVPDADASFARREVAAPIRDGEKPLWVRHAELDIAVLPVELPEGTAIRPLPLERLADASWAEQRRLRVGSDVYIPGYPATLEANEAGWPVLRRGSVATHPLVPVNRARTILINANTFGGDSGAPVVLNEGHKAIIVAVVLGMQRQTDRAIMPFEERVSHMPLALAIAAQSPFIRETIALLDKVQEEENGLPEKENIK